MIKGQKMWFLFCKWSILVPVTNFIHHLWLERHKPRGNSNYNLKSPIWKKHHFKMRHFATSIHNTIVIFFTKCCSLIEVIHLKTLDSNSKDKAPEVMPILIWKILPILKKSHFKIKHFVKPVSNTISYSHTLLFSTFFHCVHISYSPQKCIKVCFLSE